MTWYCKIYRHKAYYFTQYLSGSVHTEDVDLRHIRLRLLRSIPTDPAVFAQWLRSKRDYLDTQLASWQLDPEEWQERGLDDDELDPAEADPFDMADDLLSEISLERPALDRGHAHEMDLDRLVFHVDSIPMFRLDNMPPEDIFARCIGFDHYGHPAYADVTPEEHRYKWPVMCRVSDAVDVAADPRANIGHHELGGGFDGGGDVQTMPIHDLLLVSQSLSSCESVRVHLFEVLVGHFMLLEETRHALLELETISDLHEISKETMNIAASFLHLIASPLVFNTADRSSRSSETNNTALIWLRSNMCAKIVVDLQDERFLRMSILETANMIFGSGDPTESTIYAVLFSVFHCAIVRIDRDECGATPHCRVTSTAIMQFLPSWHAMTPSTPGISALARLACLPDPDIVIKVAHIYKLSYILEPTFEKQSATVTRSGMQTNDKIDRISALPMEIIREIAEYLSPAHLVKFASISDRTWAAAATILRWPFIDDYRLVSVRVANDPAWIMRDDSTDPGSSSGGQRYVHLCSGTFNALAPSDGACVQMRVGRLPPYLNYVDLCSAGVLRLSGLVNLSAFESQPGVRRARYSNLPYHVLRWKEGLEEEMKRRYGELVGRREGWMLEL